MCISEKTLELYIERVETLISGLNTGVLQVQEDVGSVKNDVGALKIDVSYVKKDTSESKLHLKHINGRVQDHEKRLSKEETARSPAFRAVGCPYGENISSINQSMMSEAVLKEFLKEQAKLRDKKTARWIGVASGIFSVITIVAMIAIAIITT